MDMLLNALKNLILPLVMGEDRICRCLCARENAYHVVPYHEATVEVYSPEPFTIPEDVIPVMAGLVAGVFIFWSLLWLVVISSSFLGDRSLLWKPKFKSRKDSHKLPLPPNIEDLSEDGADADSDMLTKTKSKKRKIK